MRKQTGSRNRGWLSAIGNRLSVVAGVALAVGMLAFAGSAQAATKYWRGGATPAAQGQVWTNAANWESSPGLNDAVGMPGSGDDVIIDHNSTYAPLLNFNILTLPYTIQSLTIGTNTAAGYNNSTLTVTNGNVSDKVLNVTLDVLIGAKGTLQHAAETAQSTTLNSETQRLFLNVGGNMTIAAGGKIDVSFKGYAGISGWDSGNGPGGGTAQRKGGGYGGQGVDSAGGGTTYGSVTNPVNNGSAGGKYQTQGHPGGGTALISVGGLLTLSGSILADGYAAPANSVNGAGSGGSVNIKAGSLAGSGTISANGGYGASDNGLAGGGGRIALVLTNANDSAFAGLAIRAYGGAGATVENGAAGTIYLKGTNQTYGTLIVKNNGQSTTRTTLIKDQTLLLDRMEAKNAGLVAPGSGSTLDLRQGCVLTSASEGRFIVNTTGITILWPAAYTVGGATTPVTLSWIGTGGLTIPANLTVATGGVLTHETITSTFSNPENHKLIASIVGNLTVDSGGQINVSAKGYSQENGPGGFVNGSRTGGSHGGVGGGMDGTTYGSVTNPVRAGSGGDAYNSEGGRAGGVVRLAISGVLTNNGTITAGGSVISGDKSDGYCAGGSVNIVAASLAGSGTISANGGYQTGTGTGSGGGGGRIAIVLTNADDTAFAGLSAISAYGGPLKGAFENGAAGTVYLKGTNTAYGRLIVDNNNGDATRRTLISSGMSDESVGDVVLKRLGRMSVSTARTLTVYGSWSNAVATNAFSGGTVVLAGTSPATVWGGNTWNNLTITTAGKQVQFQTNVIQYVYGVPAWSNNVSLLPIQNGYVNNTYWKLFKPSWGATQDVGVVTVQWSDALVNTGATFRAALGSTVSNTRNWLFVIPKGTMILLR